MNDDHVAELPRGWVQDRATEAEVEQERAVYEPFVESLRELVDLAIRTEVDLDVVRQAHEALVAVNDRLRARTREGTYGIHVGPAGPRCWGNAVMGLRNAIAPPLDIHKDGVGKAWCEFSLGAAYEGPPTLVHGGIAALVLDHLLGAAAGADGRPRMTGTLTMRYLRGTPLGKLYAEAHIERQEGRKAFVVGHLADDDGPTVEAEGVFVLPRRPTGADA
jgi:acyl-coenzyme A thioesterase PaaI-like protein